nr:MAG TPA: cell division protein [Caudoviricetes sp.]
MSLDTAENKTELDRQLDVKKIKLLRTLIKYKKQPKRIMNGFLVFVAILLTVTVASLTFETLKLNNDVKRLNNANRSLTEINTKLQNIIKGTDEHDYLDNPEP